jgi:hypothetical protein
MKRTVMVPIPISCNLAAQLGYTITITEYLPYKHNLLYLLAGEPIRS